MAGEVVYLFRAEAASSDPFATRLQAAGYHPLVLPVLSVVWRNTAHLQAALAHPEVYGGLIFTSPRAVEAVRRLGTPPAAWRWRRVYVVGPRTAAAARAMGWTPQGEEAGSGLALARLILQEPWPSRPLLFLCGERRRSELPEQLRTAGFPLEELVVYETRPATPVLPAGASAPDWVVFFSPSGWEAARSLPIKWKQVRVAAIGPTTAAALQEKGVAVMAVARTPTPEGLLAAIQEATSLS
ncbi:uroporphyrinogen-III synthase [Rhodothermus profundi]|uniref:Uroporphyrinogen-III synthase n=1 Tax=Rhodothermus profundi TaxID=633813 RepID=A0A1M6PD13_9BACT|nr:uroporphyrinogen-III synthase [Rhodothermus profundi]SHK05845.1 uroporphyrinogen-III synthase [Rhodothermus profundi]